MSQDITAVILTFNEGIHLRRCIESVQGFVTDIVVVDSFSTDETKAIAQEFEVKFYQNAWVNYSNQFQWALDHGDIKTEWILRIDADEYIEKNLKEEVTLALLDTPKDICGYYVRRKYVFLGKWIKYGAMYPIEVLRLWRRGAGRIEQRWMDEHIVLDQGTSGHLKGNIVDDNWNSVDWWIGKHNGYATREMLDLLNLKYNFLVVDDSMDRQENGQAKVKRWLKQKLYANLPFFVRPLMYFLYRYFIKLGFLDGVKGFAYHFMQGYWYRSLVDLKMLEAEGWIGQERDAEKIKQILSVKTGLKL